MSSGVFKTRFGLIAALLGMAVGTGNIWRFPRVLVSNGGGAFLIPWFLFLFLWSIPLLMIEFSLGQKLRKGVIGCFAGLTGGKYTVLGGFIVLCTLGIMFYYSVVSGWCLHYFYSAVTGGLFEAEPSIYWHQLISSWKPVYYHAIVLMISVAVLLGSSRGIEIASAMMVPALVVILMFLAAFAVTLPGRDDGLAFLFNTDFSRLADYKVWLEGLTQSAWSTGAGWGIALTYACYSRHHDDPVLTPFTTGLGNNAIELFAAFAILPTLFTFFSAGDIQTLMEGGNTGLTFISLPGLFGQMPFGKGIAVLFFAALFFAALTSLIAMLELGIRFFHDLGFSRKKAVFGLALFAFFAGLPSALDMDYFENQDWVWGIGLLLNGFFYSLLMRWIGVEKFCRDYVSIKSAFHRRVFGAVVLWLIPIQFFALLGWWFFQAAQWDPLTWWHPFKKTSIGTCLLQWGAVIFILSLLCRRLNRRLIRN